MRDFNKKTPTEKLELCGKIWDDNDTDVNFNEAYDYISSVLNKYDQDMFQHVPMGPDDVISIAQRILLFVL
jgi:hypothetical protein